MRAQYRLRDGNAGITRSKNVTDVGTEKEHFNAVG